MSNIDNAARWFRRQKWLIAAVLLMTAAVSRTEAVDRSFANGSLPPFQTVGAPSPKGPQPPCGAQPSPSYPDSTQAAVVISWSESDIGDWKPPACTGWDQAAFKRLVSISSRFVSTSTTPELLGKVGAISTLKGLRYWSTTHKQWKTLIVDAHAVTGQAGGYRHDFLPSELKPGSMVYFEEVNNLSGKANYQMRILELSANRVVFEIENISVVRYHYVPVFHPGDLQSIYFMERESASSWRFYSLTRMGQNANGILAGHEASFVNRAVAFYRHFAGIPDNQEPPAAP